MSHIEYDSCGYPHKVSDTKQNDEKPIPEIAEPVKDMTNPPGVIFYDATTGKTMKYVDPDSGHYTAGWLLWKHPDGQWVTFRKANPDDIRIITEHAHQPQSVALKPRDRDIPETAESAAEPKQWMEDAAEEVGKAELLDPLLPYTWTKQNIIAIIAAHAPCEAVPVAEPKWMRIEDLSQDRDEDERLLLALKEEDGGGCDGENYFSKIIATGMIYVTALQIIATTDDQQEYEGEGILGWMPLPAFPSEAVPVSQPTIEISVLTKQVAQFAVKDCRDCDGTGIFYGNVAICHCVLAPLLEKPSVEDVAKLVEAAQSMAEFAVGNGDVCELIARRLRAALAPFRRTQ